MKIEKLINLLQQAQEAQPNADVYFTNMTDDCGCEVRLTQINIDEDDNTIEILTEV